MSARACLTNPVPKGRAESAPALGVLTTSRTADAMDVPRGRGRDPHLNEMRQHRGNGIPRADTSEVIRVEELEVDVRRWIGATTGPQELRAHGCVAGEDNLGCVK